MRSDSADGRAAAPHVGEGESPSYEPPSILVLGTVAELTRQGSDPTDELLSDGSQIE
jgi:hypothetical protein